MGRTKNSDTQVTEQETRDRFQRQYAVSAGNGLNMRQSPRLDAPVVAVLPCGVGVFDNGLIQNGWMEVSTGRLTGWVRAEHLEPLWD